MVGDVPGRPQGVPGAARRRERRGLAGAIAHHKAIDVTRAAARRALPVADVPQRPSAHRADGRDLDLQAALATLPRKQREAVAYHYLAGMPYADVAAVIGGRADAARRSAADGIARLRKTYAGATAEGEAR